MTTEQLAFIGVCGALVFATVLMWVPYRSGRYPFAIYDQVSAISVLAPATVLSVGAHGAYLWAGAVGAIAGVTAHALVNFLTTEKLSERSAFLLGLFYLGSFAAFATCTVLGTVLARQFVNP